MDYLPKDIFVENQIKARLVDLEDYKDLKTKISEDPNDLSGWDALFKKIDTTLVQVKSKPSTEFKQLVFQSYDELLDRFPYLVEYWKKYAVTVYNIDGLERSVQVMSKSVDSCQYSLELWEDYLEALELSKSDQYEKMVELSIELNGYHFNSNSLWDRLLSVKKKESNDLLATYLKLVRIPLYEYSKYYNEFAEINKGYKIVDIITDSTQLKRYLKKYGKGEASECSEFETQQIIDEFSYDVFNRNQTRVNKKWEFEKQLSVNQPEIKPTENTETSVWIEYLDFEINSYSDDSSTIINLFERSLIPNCFREELWLKYLAYLNKYLNEGTKFQTMDAVYKRCINKFLPLNKNFIRFHYCKFLMKYEKYEASNDYILDLITYFSGDNSSKITLKQPYIDSIENCLELFEQQIPSDYLRLLENILGCYLNQEKLQDYSIQKYVSRLFNLLNDQSILVVSRSYLDKLSSEEEPQVQKLHDYINKHHSNPVFKNSVSFWKFYIEFEGLRTKNFINLNKLINYVKRNTNLPKVVINQFLTLQYNLYTNNYKQFKVQVDDETIVKYDLNLSTSIQNKDYWLSNQKSNRDLKLQFDNPGFVLDNKPEITNRITNFSIFDEDITTMATFKNVEKANMPIPYPEL